MTIIASCGHVLSDEDGPDGMGHALKVRSWSCENTRAVSFPSVCSLCMHQMTSSGVVLLTDDDVNAWLAGHGSDDQPAW